MILKFAKHTRGGEPLGLKIRTPSSEGFVLSPGGFPKGVKYLLTLLCGGWSGRLAVWEPGAH